MVFIPRRGFVVEDRIGAFARVDRIEAILRHAGDVFRKHACRVDDDLRVDHAAVGDHARDATVFEFHIKHKSVQRERNARYLRRLSA